MQVDWNSIEISKDREKLVYFLKIALIAKKLIIYSDYETLVANNDTYRVEKLDKTMK